MSVKTLCKNCSFEDSPLHCFVGRLEQIRNLPGIKVDEVNGHYEIIGKICDWSVPRYWGNQTKEELRDLAWKVRENRIIKVSFIVTTDENTTLEEIALTVRSLQNQQVEPSLIHIINMGNIDVKDILTLRKGNVPLTVEQVYLDDYIERYTWAKVQKLNTIYYGLIKAGFIIPTNFIRKMDQEFNDNLNQFAYLEYNSVEIHATLLSHEMGGDYIETNDGYRFRDKIYQWCARNQQEQLIQAWENV